MKDKIVLIVTNAFRPGMDLKWYFFCMSGNRSGSTSAAKVQHFDVTHWLVKSHMSGWLYLTWCRNLDFWTEVTAFRLKGGAGGHSWATHRLYWSIIDMIENKYNGVIAPRDIAGKVTFQTGSPSFTSSLCVLVCKLNATINCWSIVK